MTYLQFHLTWILPPLLLLAWPGVRAIRGFGRRGWLALVAPAVIAIVYTTPWDNYLVYREVWGYPAGRVLARIGYVPVEEYLFFALQPLLTGLATFISIRTWLPHIGEPTRHGAWSSPRAAVKRSVFVVGLGVLALGVVALRDARGLYLGLILVWATPVLLAMWAYSSAAIWALRAPLLTAIGLSTAYLAAADRYAIRAGIWWISDAWSTGVDILGLPIEEGLFFLFTNMLVAGAVVLFLEPGFGAPANVERAAPDSDRSTRL